MIHTVKSSISLFAVAFILASLGTIASAAKLPSVFKKCPKISSDDNACLAKAVEHGIKMLANGMPSLGLPPLEPVEITELKMGHGQANTPVSMYLYFANVKIYGIANTSMIEQSTYFEEDPIRLVGRSMSPSLKFEGDYEVDGKVLVLPVKGKGKAVFLLENVDGTSVLTGNKEKRKGKIYFKLDKYNFTFNPSGLKIKLDNLFEGNKQLGDATNRVLNDNWEAVFQEVKPGFEEALSAVFQSFANKLYNKVPMDEIYPTNIS